MKPEVKRIIDELTDVLIHLQEMRENGESDLRQIIHFINFKIEEISNG